MKNIFSLLAITLVSIVTKPAFATQTYVLDSDRAVLSEGRVNLIRTADTPNTIHLVVPVTISQPAEDCLHPITRTNCRVIPGVYTYFVREVRVKLIFKNKRPEHGEKEEYLLDAFHAHPGTFTTGVAYTFQEHVPGTVEVMNAVDIQRRNFLGWHSIIVKDKAAGISGDIDRYQANFNP